MVSEVSEPRTRPVKRLIESATPVGDISRCKDRPWPPFPNNLRIHDHVEHDSGLDRVMVHIGVNGAARWRLSSTAASAASRKSMPLVVDANIGVTSLKRIQLRFGRARSPFVNETVKTDRYRPIRQQIARNEPPRFRWWRSWCDRSPRIHLPIGLRRVNRSHSPHELFALSEWA